MKISYNHIINNIGSQPTIDDISSKLFQLGHEHEIYDKVFDIEITPNRGDCLSLNGILKELSVFYDVNHHQKEYKDDLKPLSINFQNNAKQDCPIISFLKIEVDSIPGKYSGVLKDYHDDLSLNKNNFFTDISNYISYETGQPTHCYDSNKLGNSLTLDYLDKDYIFETLIGKSISLTGKNLVFLQDNEVINLAGIMGGKSTSCSKDTKSVIIECAYFNPEEIIGKSIKYDINSDAAYKFERGVDPLCHESVLRRFLKIVSDHTSIKNAEQFSKDFKKIEHTKIEFDLDIVSKIIGSDVEKDNYINYLTKLGFGIKENFINVPSYRSDVKNNNDIAEEIARVIGFDNIDSKKIKIPTKNISSINSETMLKTWLIDKGFFEVINNPFVSDKTKDSLIIDNPLDSNKIYLRTSLRNSLIDNLLYNERRQNESIKLFEFSDIYLKENRINKRRHLGVIASGKMGKNYRDFSKAINIEYFSSIFKEILPDQKFEFQEISRNNLDTKIKTPIIYFEIDFDSIKSDIQSYDLPVGEKNNFIKYVPISEFPKTNRDLSFSITKFESMHELDNLILNYQDELIKDIFIFDYFDNSKKGNIKVGYRFIFQSKERTLADNDVNPIMDKIIDKSLAISGVDIPGLS